MEKIETRFFSIWFIRFERNAWNYKASISSLGPVTHYLYITLDKLFPGTGLANSILKVLTDRLVFSPAFLFLTIYLLGRLQGLNHTEAMDTIKEKYVTSLFANWKIWTLPQVVNINLVAPQYRVLFANLVALVWNFYLASSKTKWNIDFFIYDLGIC